MSQADQVERELKLGAWPEFVLPDLQGAIDGITVNAGDVHELQAVYYDTTNLDLLRRGATLRFRTGEPPGDVWTAKLPSVEATRGLARRELTRPGRRDGMPDQFADLVRGWAFGTRVRPVARIQTRRRSLLLCNESGAELATLDDDMVTVTRGRRVLARFRELEVELIGDAPAELLGMLDERLHAAGAEKVSQIPKLGRALGRAAAVPWALTSPAVGAKPTLADAAHAELVATGVRLVDLHAALVLDADDSATAMARAARQLGAALAAFEPLFDVQPPAAIRTGLDVLTAALAPVSELDVVRARVPHEPGLRRAAAQALASRADATRERARKALARALRATAYVRMLQALERLAAEPPPPSRAGARRAGTAAAKLARTRWKTLRDAPSADLELLDSLAAIVALNGDVDASGRATQLVDLAEAHAQARSTAARLETLARRADGNVQWAAGVLAGRELARADEADAQRRAAIAQAASS